jgi:hypothetical protein
MRRLPGGRSCRQYLGEAKVEDGKIRLVMLSQGDRLGHRAGDAANFVPLIDEDLFH